MSYTCNYRGTDFTVPNGDPAIGNSEYNCRPSPPGEGDPTTFPGVTLQPAIDQGSATAGPGGLDPMAPGGPGQSRAWGEALLSWLFGDDDTVNTTTTPQAAASAAAGAGCCPDAHPACLACWLKGNWRWLLIVALAVAAYKLRKTN